jgi:hypothetical protein
LVSLSAQGAVIALCTVSDVSNHVQALAATIDSTTGNSLIVAGVTYTQAYSYINPIVSFLDIGSNSGSVAWSVVLRSSWEGRFTDVLTTAHGVYAVGYSTGFSPEFQKMHGIFVLLNASNGDAIKAVRIGGPGNTQCLSIAKGKRNSLTVACRAEGKATMFSFDATTLVPENLISGYYCLEDVVSTLVPTVTDLTIVGVSASQVVELSTWTPSACSHSL